METQGQDRGGPELGARLIKRYANRKLYDTRDSRYVTLQQIAIYVRDGEDVTIIDNTTKEDLTNVTLAQIIYEEEKKGDESTRTASAGTLRQLIQHGSERLMSTLREGPVGKLIARKDEDEEAEALEKKKAADEKAAADSPSEPASSKDGKRSVFASSKEALDELQRLADDRIKGLLGYAVTHVQQLQGEVKRMQTRIEELEERLVKLGARRKDEGDPPDEP